MDISDTEVILIVSIVCTPFCIGGALYMMYSFLRSSSRSFSSKLVFCLALSDLLLGAVSLFEIIFPQGYYCDYLGFLRLFGIYSNMLWTT